MLGKASMVAAALSMVALAEDRLPDAQQMIAESISLRQQLGESVSLAQSKLVLADILLEVGDGSGSDGRGGCRCGLLLAAAGGQDNHR